MSINTHFRYFISIQWKSVIDTLRFHCSPCWKPIYMHLLSFSGEFRVDYQFFLYQPSQISRQQQQKKPNYWLNEQMEGNVSINIYSIYIFSVSLWINRVNRAVKEISDSVSVRMFADVTQFKWLVDSNSWSPFWDTKTASQMGGWLVTKMCSFIHFNWLTLGAHCSRLIGSRPEYQLAPFCCSWTLAIHSNLSTDSELSVIYIINRWANDVWIEWWIIARKQTLGSDPKL